MPLPDKLSFEERVELRLQYVEAGVREVRGRQLHLEDDWKEFVPAVTNRIAKEIIVPAIVTGLMNSLSMPSALLDTGRSVIDDIVDARKEVEHERGRVEDG